jgi:hypothetical protein
MFTAFYDAPERLQDAFELVTRTYERFMRRWCEVVPPREGPMFAHWGAFYPGRIMLRQDSVVNLSAAMYAQQVRPYDERLLGAFGDGAIHFCGKADHAIAAMAATAGLRAVNMSQPHLNDMPHVLAETVGRKLFLNLPAQPEGNPYEGLDLTRGVALQ